MLASIGLVSVPLNVFASLSLFGAVVDDDVVAVVVVDVVVAINVHVDGIFSSLIWTHCGHCISQPSVT